MSVKKFIFKKRKESSLSVENRNVSIDEKIILEDTNTNNNETNAICTKAEDTQKVSKQVNKQNTPYRDALIRSNCS
jgi:hypothetical protein